MKVDGNNITMTRGDSETISIFCKDILGTIVPFVTGDTVYFTIKRDIHEEAIILQKIITIFTDGKAIAVILPIDTKALEFMAYIYDVQITKADGTVSTIIPPSKFTIGGEVTYE